MNLRQRIVFLRAVIKPAPLRDWYHVGYDEEKVRVWAERPGREPWSQEFIWDSVQRVVFKAEGPRVSDAIYVFSSSRPESFVIPTEADGANEFWQEILRRGLFDPELAIQAAGATYGAFTWPPN